MESSMDEHEDKIRDVVAKRAEQLGYTAYEISMRLDKSPTPESIKRYLTRRCSMTTSYVSRILDVLRLEIKPK